LIKICNGITQEGIEKIEAMILQRLKASAKNIVNLELKQKS
jgi:hypothetical protein